MERLNHYLNLPPHYLGGVVCIGNFDGVHTGHQAMLARGRALASAGGIPLLALTFDPHPLSILRPESAPAPLATLEQRLRWLEQAGVDATIVLPATTELLAMSAEDFIRRVLVDCLRVRQVVEGPNFRFGRGAAGSIETLQTLGGTSGFEVTVLTPQTAVLGDSTIVPVSSSLTRWLIGQGRVRDAEACLGRPYQLSGTVVEGDRRGRTLGFPTANIAIQQMLPGVGVYAATARVGLRTYAAALSVSSNPTFVGKTVTVETYLLDFTGDLYGRVLELDVRSWLRDTMKFGGVEQLKRQLERDAASVRAMSLPVG